MRPARSSGYEPVTLRSPLDQPRATAESRRDRPQLELIAVASFGAQRERREHRDHLVVPRRRGIDETLLGLVLVREREEGYHAAMRGLPMRLPDASSEHDGGVRAARVGVHSECRSGENTRKETLMLADFVRPFLRWPSERRDACRGTN